MSGFFGARARAGWPGWKTVPIAVFVLLISGCATQPLDGLSQPAFTMPAKFARSGDARVGRDWWRAFHDPGLDRLINRALGDNFNLKSAYARIRQARATVTIQRAGLFPTLTGGFSEDASRRSRPSSFDLSGLNGFGGAGISSGTGAAGSGNTSGTGGSSGFNFGSSSKWNNSETLSLQTNYEIDLWGRLRNARDAAGFDLLTSASALQSAAIMLAGNIASTWYQYQELESRITLLESQIKTNKDVLDLTTFSFANGQAAAADVLRQRRTVENSRGQLAQTRAQARVQAHALAVLVGVAPQRFAPPGGQLVTLPPLPQTGVPSTLLMRRPDVRQDYYTIAADNRRVAVALAERYPQLSLSASIANAGSLSALFSDWVLQLGASLTQPLFDAGQRRAQVVRAKATVDEDVYSYQQTLLQALQEVGDALVNETQQQKFLGHLDKQLTLSRQAVANLRLRYLRGATSYLDVLNALLTYQQLQVNRLTGRRQLLDYRINLYRALAGGIGPRPTRGAAAPRGVNYQHPAADEPATEPAEQPSTS